MSEAYVRCSECRQRALAVATRCPRCGHEFPPRPLRPPSRASRLGPLLAVLAAVVLGVAAVGLVTRMIRRAVSAGPAATPSGAVASADTATTPAPASTGERRFAKTWTKVRNRRSVTGDVVGVLLPGDSVRVDSLVRGWWLVTLEGRVLGYVHQTTLDTVPPPPP